MRILAFKPDHDGASAVIDGGNLIWSIEGEKDSCGRHSPLSPMNLLDSLAGDVIPDVIALSGWGEGAALGGRQRSASYLGLESQAEHPPLTLLGHRVRCFSSSHERSHLLCAYGMSPLPQGQPCYALVWEGTIGAFYEIDEHITIRKLGSVLDWPGVKYEYIYFLAQSRLTLDQQDTAGKVMALAAFADGSPMTPDEAYLISGVLHGLSVHQAGEKDLFRSSPFYSVGVESQAFKNLAAKFSDALFEAFFQFARQHLGKRLPLLISGGCGLNCDWNTRWRDCGRFESVFVPPCANDTGSAIGTAIDAQLFFTGNAKLHWSVYAGLPFVRDTEEQGPFRRQAWHPGRVAEFLRRGNVIGFVHGNSEIGPRALGHRSLLASPLEAGLWQRLNQIKQREAYRPIAPVCLEEDVSRHFNWVGPSPYMLYFQRLRTDRLPAITHVDGTARVQTLTRDENENLHALLTEFRKRTGFGVLCNTSLNFKGRGFINRMTDVVRYATETGLDGFVVEDEFYCREGKEDEAGGNES
jgi:predicted NodU family carbamoyl transferase